MALLDGTALSIDGVPLRRLTILVEHALDGQMGMLARFDDVAEYEALRVSMRFGTVHVVPRGPDIPDGGRGPVAWIRRRLGLLRKVTPADIDAPPVAAFVGGPTLELEFRVPTSHDLTLRLPGSPEIVVGDVSGDLVIELAGRSTARVGATYSARAELGGEADVRIEGVEGGINAELAGASRLVVGTLRDGDAYMRVRERAGIEVEGGEAGDATISVDGAVRVALAILVTGDLDVSGRGGFHVEVGRVLGESSAAWTGDGRLRVGEPA